MDLSSRILRRTSSMQRRRAVQTLTQSRRDDLRVAVLYQALEPPVIDGVQKPKKPGGYQDSGADIAWVLQNQAGVPVVTPAAAPDPQHDVGWCFPDHEQGILDAVKRGATHLWANTILFAHHPLQTSTGLVPYEQKLRVVGQPPRFVDLFDDKNFVNSSLKRIGGFTLPDSFTATSIEELDQRLKVTSARFPLVGKPIRGRGSHGVKVCFNESDLRQHAETLLEESPDIMIESFLAGEEITITVMPPSGTHNEYRALPVVTRFNHQDSIAPYNGVVAVSQNSRTITDEEYTSDDTYQHIAKECEKVARLLRCTAPIRVDCRRFENNAKSPFALFDVNMKPNMTGPGRPGREDQASLTAMAASALGWDYPELLSQIIASSRTLYELRTATSPLKRQ